jgi:hypothetical protein
MARSIGGGTRRLTCALTCLLGTAWLTALGCSANDASMTSAGSNDESYNPNASAAGGSASYNGAAYAKGGTPAAVQTTAPETKVNVDFEAPQSSLNYVYAANAERDNVAVIDASTLTIHVVDTGDQPRFLRTIPGKDAALLVDVGAGDLAYIETSNGKSSVSYYRDLPSANVVRVAPDGKHAVAYFDVNLMQQGKFETLQDVSVMSFGDLAPLATRMTVGFKARQVTFAGDASSAPAAYVVTDDGISILDFAQIDLDRKPAIAKTIPIFSATEPKGADISVTPDGSFAIGRIQGTSTVRLVELASGNAHTLDLVPLLPGPTKTNGIGGSSGTGGAANGGAGGATGTNSQSSMAGAANGGAGGAAGTNSQSSMGGAATGGASSSSSTAVPAPEISDLEVSPDGKFALAVSRDRGVLLRLPIPAGFADTSQITKLQIADVIVGSAAISPNGNWAVLFTTAVQTERRVVIVDLTGILEPRVLDLNKSIKGVAFSSSGNQAYVLHNKANGDPLASGIDTQTILDRSYGYTLVDLPKAFRKLMVTDADPNLSVTTPNAPYVFLTFKGQSTTVQRLDMDSLQVSSVVLGSVPISLGVVPAARRAFINQDYAEGRLTFIDWETLDTRTVTGYELNSKIRE